MIRIVDPVLRNLDQRTLRSSIPSVFHSERVDFICLEALGRSLVGMAPWLELDSPGGMEARLQEEYRTLTRSAIDAATDPESPDFMNFRSGNQPLVDAGFLAEAIVRAPDQLFFSLDKRVRSNLLNALISSREIRAYHNNWLFFSAMVEAAIFLMAPEKFQIEPVEKAVSSFENWYVGDGTYSDGAFFHWDYYNSLVIHPMYIDTLRIVKSYHADYEAVYSKELQRAKRYSRILEQLINPDGSYPVFGRSSTYRFGAFQLLAQAALLGFLPEEINDSQVRCGLEAVIRKVLSNPDTFDADGWLRPGVFGHQPDLAESYISTGSLYLCTPIFLPLGLPAEHAFWADHDTDWTAKKIWSGKNTTCDHAID